MLKNQSVATIAAPEFINIEPYNPLISQCEIKVLYVGENRNGSYITEEVAKDMANSLPGTPIVAAFIPDKKDFGDHGHVVTIEDGEVKFSCKTQPYGFVAPDAKVWFKNFVDTDEFGVETERKYLMTNGYLWTGQYPEIQKALDEGLPQSMELDEKSLDGHWAKNRDSGIEFFIINDATFSKLCILGSDVEPCFEGASVTDKQVSKEFSKDPHFMNTLFTMMNELKDALQNSEGGSDMPNEELDFEEQKKPAEEISVIEESGNSEEDADTAGEPAAQADGVAEASLAEGAVEEDASDEEFACGKKKQYVDDEDEDEFACGKKKQYADDEPAEESEVEDEKKPAADHSLEDVEAEFAAVKAELETTKSLLDAANAELISLREFKLGIENQQKDALIAKYHMLSDEDKAEIVAHKEEYSLEQIEAKLALMYVEKNVDFSTVTGEKEDEVVEESSPITTFSLDSAVDTTYVSPILQALRDAKN